MTATQRLREELELLLDESVESVKQREKTAFDEAVGSFANSFVIFGAGGIGRKTLQGLRSDGIEPLAFSDNNSRLWGTEIEGIKVLSPQDAAAKYGKTAAFLVAIWGGAGRDAMADRIRPLVALGCSKVLSFGTLFWKYPEILLPHFCLDLPHKVLAHREEILRAFELWSDDSARREFVAQIKWRLHLDFDVLGRPVAHDTYFPEDLVTATNHEVFVDCGAFDGDTLGVFLRTRKNAFDGFIAFEADPGSYGKLKNYVATLPPEVQSKITVYPLAVGATRCKVLFDAQGTVSSAIGHGTLEIDCAPIDEILGDTKVTWLKMDIESAEPDALEGARHLIKTQTPALAICVYHLQDHVWRIPLLISEMSKDYRFFLRPHMFENYDLVCYAIPAARLEKPKA